ncbi:MAG: hypothetical protein JWM23_188 [Microbacteriaceae bacterium]|nr:hypothetical protein [Microbacteriaceae bacterium]
MHDGPPTAAVVRELLALGVLRIDDVVEHGLVVSETSVSHRSFRIRLGEREDLFVKQVDPVRSHGRDLVTEAAVYRLARASPPLADVVPPCHAIGVSDELIVLGAVRGTPLSETAFAFGGVDATALSVLCEYGRAVARVHRVRPPTIGHEPWLLAALEPGWGNYGWLPRPCGELLMRLAATPALRRGFSRAAASWRVDGLVHGDLRWSNVLVALDEVPPRIWLVDWELACLGDPAWDIASVLADLLASAAMRGLYAGRLPDVWAPAHAFLAGYRSGAAPAPDAWQALVERGTTLAGVRLVQTLVEFGHQGAEVLAAVEPVLLPWASTLLNAPRTIVSELARSPSMGCP